MDLQGVSRYQPFPPFAEWRGLPVRSELWNRFAERATKATSAVEGGLTLARRKSMVAAALNTGAIENIHGADRGLTQTVIDHALNWQPHVRAAEGSDAEAHVAAALEAYDMALDIATTAEPLTQSWIRQLHAVTCRQQLTYEVHVVVGDRHERGTRPLPHGAYKDLPNNVTLGDGSTHWYAPVEETGPEMTRLLDELQSEAFLTAHPAVQAAYAHHSFTWVHPFQDGNGRVVRALTSVFLLRSHSIPFLVYDDQRGTYFDALAAADAGDHLAFLRFVEDRAIDLMALAPSLVAARTPAILAAEPRIVDELAARRLLELADRRLLEIATELPRPFGVDLQSSSTHVGGGPTDLDGWRLVAGHARVVKLQSANPSASAEQRLQVLVSSDSSKPFPVALRAHGSTTTAEFRVADIDPAISASASVRLDAFLRQVLSDLVEDFNGQRGV